MSESTSSTLHPAHAAVAAELDAAYRQLERAIANQIGVSRDPVFTTDADPASLWTLYLSAFPEAHRQHYTCNACRHFIERYAGLVTIDSDGRAHPLLWTDVSDVPADLLHLVLTLGEYVAGRKVTGVFRWAAEMWGTVLNVSAKTGVTWTHLHGRPAHHHTRRDLTPEQQMAALKEDYGILNRSLADYPAAAVEEAVRVLGSGALQRSEKAEPIARWFLALHRELASAKGPLRRNLVWRAVATAPAGWTHVRTTVLSTLLDDIVAGLPYEEVRARWAEKMHPLQYQRPTAAPTAGQIDAAERKVAQLGVERSLARRFATLDDVRATLWTPAEPVLETQPVTGGVFRALREPEGVKRLDLPPQTLSWRRFRETVLETAVPPRTIELYVPERGPFFGLTAAADAEAPPILQWDGLEGQPRNPVAWYFYVGGSPARQWQLAARTWTPVTAIFRPPFAWQAPERFAHHDAERVFLAIDGAKDADKQSSALFPETLRAELREIRATIEAYSKKTPLAGGDAPRQANGIAFGRQTGTPLQLRVTTAQGPQVYVIERWD